MLKMSRFVNPKVSKVQAVRLLLASYDNAILEDFLQTFPAPWQSTCRVCPFIVIQPLQFVPSCPIVQNITYWLLSFVEVSTGINLPVVGAIVCPLSWQEKFNISKEENNKILCCCDNLSFFILCDNLKWWQKYSFFVRVLSGIVSIPWKNDEKMTFEPQWHNKWLLRHNKHTRFEDKSVCFFWTNSLF